MIRRTSYFPDDLPQPKAASTVEKHYLQCGCTVNESTQEYSLPYAYYGDIISYIPASSPKHTSPLNKAGQSSPVGTPPRSASPPPSESEEEQAMRIVDTGFCERASCRKSSVFNKEWNRLWELHNSEMKASLDENETTGGKSFENFKARIRKEAQEATEQLLREQ